MQFRFINRFDKKIMSYIIIFLFSAQAYFYFSPEAQINSYSKSSNRSIILNKGYANETDKIQWLAKMKNVYSQRAKAVDEACKIYKRNFSNDIILPPIKWSSRELVQRKEVTTMMFDSYFKWGYCAVMKVGSSTISDHLKILMTTKSRPDRFEDSFVENWRAHQMNTFFKVPPPLINKGWIQNDSVTIIRKEDFTNFMLGNDFLLFTFVRHPFERLISAYKSKALHRTYVADQRTKALLEGVKSFSDFVDLVLIQHHENDGQGVNAHWKAISQKCHHCAIPYNVIGRMETFDEDLNYIILQLGLENILPIKNINTLSNTNQDSKQHIANTAKTKESLEYFSKLKKSQIEQLYQIYKIDFEMFGYSAKDYLSLV